MASNFQIFSFKTRDSLHLKLTGDFDGSSAYELINTLTEHGKGFYEIFIDTSELKTIHSFGKDVLQKNLSSSNKLYRNLVFIGRNVNEIRRI
jgi:anti-anti-sigma regulatory factor